LRIFSREANFSFVFIELVPDGSIWETKDKWKTREKIRRWKTGLRPDSTSAFSRQNANYFACFFWIVSNQVEIIYSSARNSKQAK
jgi:hypothetical protein